jgi:hypothetical protein
MAGMKLCFLIGLVYFSGLNAAGTPLCAELFSIIGSNHLLFEQKKSYEVSNTKLDLLAEIESAAQAIHKERPKVKIIPLRSVLEMALENAIQHGEIGGASTVELIVSKRPDGIFVHVLNDSNHPLPRTLRDKTFSSESMPILVPNNERDRQRGHLGEGISVMLTDLRDVYQSNSGKEPTICWKEVQSPLSGRQKVIFELKLP